MARPLRPSQRKAQEYSENYRNDKARYIRDHKEYLKSQNIAHDKMSDDQILRDMGYMAQTYGTLDNPGNETLKRELVRLSQVDDRDDRSTLGYIPGVVYDGFKKGGYILGSMAAGANALLGDTLNESLLDAGLDPDGWAYALLKARSGDVSRKYAEKWGNEAAKSGGPVKSLEDVSFPGQSTGSEIRNLFDFSLAASGEVVPTMAAIAGTGIGGAKVAAARLAFSPTWIQKGLINRALKKQVKKNGGLLSPTLASQANRKLILDKDKAFAALGTEGQEVAKAYVSSLGNLGGSFLASGTLGMGEVYNELYPLTQLPKNHPEYVDLNAAQQYAWTFGNAIGALDGIVPSLLGSKGSQVLRKFFPGKKTISPVDVSRADAYVKKSVLRAMALGMGIEGSTEAAQEFLSLTANEFAQSRKGKDSFQDGFASDLGGAFAGATPDRVGDEKFWRLLDAGFMGLIGGGMAGGAFTGLDNLAPAEVLGRDTGSLKSRVAERDRQEDAELTERLRVKALTRDELEDRANKIFGAEKGLEEGDKVVLTNGQEGVFKNFTPLSNRPGEGEGFATIEIIDDAGMAKEFKINMNFVFPATTSTPISKANRRQQVIQDQQDLSPLSQEPESQTPNTEQEEPQDTGSVDRFKEDAKGEEESKSTKIERPDSLVKQELRETELELDERPGSRISQGDLGAYNSMSSIYDTEITTDVLINEPFSEKLRKALPTDVYDQWRKIYYSPTETQPSKEDFANAFRRAHKIIHPEGRETAGDTIANETARAAEEARIKQDKKLADRQQARDEEAVNIRKVELLNKEYEEGKSVVKITKQGQRNLYPTIENKESLTKEWTVESIDDETGFVSIKSDDTILTDIDPRSLTVKKKTKEATKTTLDEFQGGAIIEDDPSGSHPNQKRITLPSSKAYVTFEPRGDGVAITFIAGDEAVRGSGPKVLNALLELHPIVYSDSESKGGMSMQFLRMLQGMEARGEVNLEKSSYASRINSSAPVYKDGKPIKAKKLKLSDGSGMQVGKAYKITKSDSEVAPKKEVPRHLKEEVKEQGSEMESLPPIQNGTYVIQFGNQESIVEIDDETWSYPKSGGTTGPAGTFFRPRTMGELLLAMGKPLDSLDSVRFEDEYIYNVNFDGVAFNYALKNTVVEPIPLQQGNMVWNYGDNETTDLSDSDQKHVQIRSITKIGDGMSIAEIRSSIAEGLATRKNEKGRADLPPDSTKVTRGKSLAIIAILHEPTGQVFVRSAGFTGNVSKGNQGIDIFNFKKRGKDFVSALPSASNMDLAKLPDGFTAIEVAVLSARPGRLSAKFDSIQEYEAWTLTLPEVADISSAIPSATSLLIEQFKSNEKPTQVQSRDFQLNFQMEMNDDGFAFTLDENQSPVIQESVGAHIKQVGKRPAWHFIKIDDIEKQIGFGDDAPLAPVYNKIFEVINSKSRTKGEMSHEGMDVFVESLRIGEGNTNEDGQSQIDARLFGEHIKGDIVNSRNKKAFAKALVGAIYERTKRQISAGETSREVLFEVAEDGNRMIEQVADPASSPDFDLEFDWDANNPMDAAKSVFFQNFSTDQLNIVYQQAIQENANEMSREEIKDLFLSDLEAVPKVEPNKKPELLSIPEMAANSEIEVNAIAAFIRWVAETVEPVTIDQAVRANAIVSQDADALFDLESKFYASKGITVRNLYDDRNLLNEIELGDMQKELLSVAYSNILNAIRSPKDTVASIQEAFTSVAEAFNDNGIPAFGALEDSGIRNIKDFKQILDDNAISEITQDVFIGYIKSALKQVLPDSKTSPIQLMGEHLGNTLGALNTMRTNVEKLMIETDAINSNPIAPGAKPDSSMMLDQLPHTITEVTDATIEYEDNLIRSLPYSFSQSINISPEQAQRNAVTLQKFFPDNLPGASMSAVALQQIGKFLENSNTMGAEFGMQLHQHLTDMLVARDANGLPAIAFDVSSIDSSPGTIARGQFINSDGYSNPIVQINPAFYLGEQDVIGSPFPFTGDVESDVFMTVAMHELWHGTMEEPLKIYEDTISRGEDSPIQETIDLIDEVIRAIEGAAQGTSFSSLFVGDYAMARREILNRAWNRRDFAEFLSGIDVSEDLRNKIDKNGKGFIKSLLDALYAAYLKLLDTLGINTEGTALRALLDLSKQLDSQHRELQATDEAYQASEEIVEAVAAMAEEPAMSLYSKMAQVLNKPKDMPEIVEQALDPIAIAQRINQLTKGNPKKKIPGLIRQAMMEGNQALAEKYKSELQRLKDQQKSAKPQGFQLPEQAQADKWTDLLLKAGVTRAELDATIGAILTGKQIVSRVELAEIANMVNQSKIVVDAMRIEKKWTSFTDHRRDNLFLAGESQPGSNVEYIEILTYAPSFKPLIKDDLLNITNEEMGDVPMQMGNLDSSKLNELREKDLLSSFDLLVNASQRSGPGIYLEETPVIKESILIKTQYVPKSALTSMDSVLGSSDPRLPEVTSGHIKLILWEQRGNYFITVSNTQVEELAQKAKVGGTGDTYGAEYPVRGAITFDEGTLEAANMWTNEIEFIQNASEKFSEFFSDNPTVGPLNIQYRLEFELEAHPYHSTHGISLIDQIEDSSALSELDNNDFHNALIDLAVDLKKTPPGRPIPKVIFKPDKVIDLGLSITGSTIRELPEGAGEEFADVVIDNFYNQVLNYRRPSDGKTVLRMMAGEREISNEVHSEIIGKLRYDVVRVRDKFVSKFKDKINVLFKILGGKVFDDGVYYSPDGLSDLDQSFVDEKGNKRKLSELLDEYLNGNLILDETIQEMIEIGSLKADAEILLQFEASYEMDPMGPRSVSRDITQPPRPPRMDPLRYFIKRTLNTQSSRERYFNVYNDLIVPQIEFGNKFADLINEIYSDKTELMPTEYGSYTKDQVTRVTNKISQWAQRYNELVISIPVEEKGTKRLARILKLKGLTANVEDDGLVSVKAPTDNQLWDMQIKSEAGLLAQIRRRGAEVKIPVSTHHDSHYLTDPQGDSYGEPQPNRHHLRVSFVSLPADPSNPSPTDGFNQNPSDPVRTKIAFIDESQSDVDQKAQEDIVTAIEDLSYYGKYSESYDLDGDFGSLHAFDPDEEYKKGDVVVDGKAIFVAQKDHYPSVVDTTLYKELKELGIGDETIAQTPEARSGSISTPSSTIKSGSVNPFESWRPLGKRKSGVEIGYSSEKRPSNKKILEQIKNIYVVELIPAGNDPGQVLDKRFTLVHIQPELIKFHDVNRESSEDYRQNAGLEVYDIQDSPFKGVRVLEGRDGQGEMLQFEGTKMDSWLNQDQIKDKIKKYGGYFFSGGASVDSIEQKVFDLTGQFSDPVDGAPSIFHKNNELTSFKFLIREMAKRGVSRIVFTRGDVIYPIVSSTPTDIQEAMLQGSMKSAGIQQAYLRTAQMVSKYLQAPLQTIGRPLANVQTEADKKAELQKAVQSVLGLMTEAGSDMKNPRSHFEILPDDRTPYDFDPNLGFGGVTDNITAGLSYPDLNDLSPNRVTKALFRDGVVEFTSIASSRGHNGRSAIFALDENNPTAIQVLADEDEVFIIEPQFARHDKLSQTNTMHVWESVIGENALGVNAAPKTGTVETEGRSFLNGFTRLKISPEKKARLVEVARQANIQSQRQKKLLRALLDTPMINSVSKIRDKTVDSVLDDFKQVFKSIEKSLGLRRVHYTNETEGGLLEAVGFSILEPGQVYQALGQPGSTSIRERMDNLDPENSTLVTRGEQTARAKDFYVLQRGEMPINHEYEGDDIIITKTDLGTPGVVLPKYVVDETHKRWDEQRADNTNNNLDYTDMHILIGFLGGYGKPVNAGTTWAELHRLIVPFINKIGTYDSIKDAHADFDKKYEVFNSQADSIVFMPILFEYNGAYVQYALDLQGRDIYENLFRDYRELQVPGSGLLDLTDPAGGQIQDAYGWSPGQGGAYLEQTTRQPMITKWWLDYLFYETHSSDYVINRRGPAKSYFNGIGTPFSTLEFREEIGVKISDSVRKNRNKLRRSTDLETLDVLSADNLDLDRPSLLMAAVEPLTPSGESIFAGNITTQNNIIEDENPKIIEVNPDAKRPKRRIHPVIINRFPKPNAGEINIANKTGQGLDQVATDIRQTWEEVRLDARDTEAVNEKEITKLLEPLKSQLEHLRPNPNPTGATQDFQYLDIPAERLQQNLTQGERYLMSDEIRGATKNTRTHVTIEKQSGEFVIENGIISEGTDGARVTDPVYKVTGLPNEELLTENMIRRGLVRLKSAPSRVGVLVMNDDGTPLIREAHSLFREGDLKHWIPNEELEAYEKDDVAEMSDQMDFIFDGREDNRGKYLVVENGNTDLQKGQVIQRNEANKYSGSGALFRKYDEYLEELEEARNLETTENEPADISERKTPVKNNRDLVKLITRDYVWDHDDYNQYMLIAQDVHRLTGIHMNRILREIDSINQYYSLVKPEYRDKWRAIAITQGIKTAPQRMRYMMSDPTVANPGGLQGNVMPEENSIALGKIKAAAINEASIAPATSMQEIRAILGNEKMSLEEMWPKYLKGKSPDNQMKKIVRNYGDEMRNQFIAMHRYSDNIRDESRKNANNMVEYQINHILKRKAEIENSLDPSQPDSIINDIQELQDKTIIDEAHLFDRSKYGDQIRRSIDSLVASTQQELTDETGEETTDVILKAFKDITGKAETDQKFRDALQAVESSKRGSISPNIIADLILEVSQFPNIEQLDARSLYQTVNAKINDIDKSIILSAALANHKDLIYFAKISQSRDITGRRDFVAKLEDLAKSTLGELKVLVDPKSRGFFPMGGAIEKEVQMQFAKNRIALFEAEERRDKALTDNRIYDVLFSNYDEVAKRLSYLLGHNPSNQVSDGTMFPVMTRLSDGSFGMTEIEVQMNNSMQFENFEQLKEAILMNKEYLKDAPQEHVGSPDYNYIKQMTRNAEILPIWKIHTEQGGNFRLWSLKSARERFEMMGVRGANVSRMILNFENAVKRERPNISRLAREWNFAFDQARKNWGFSHGHIFMDQVITPIIKWNEDQPQLSNDKKAFQDGAFKMAKRLVNTEQDDSILRNTLFKLFDEYEKSADYHRTIAQKYGLKVRDEKSQVRDMLGRPYDKDKKRYGDYLFRDPIQRGYLTVPRVLKSNVVQMVIDELPKYGWAMDSINEEDKNAFSWEKLAEQLKKKELSQEAKEGELELAIIELLGNDDMVLNRFIAPYITNTSPRELFLQPNPELKIPRSELVEAWEMTSDKKDPFERFELWIDILYGRLNPKEDRSDYVDFKHNILKKLRNRYKQLRRSVKDYGKNTLEGGITLAGHLMDSRAQDAIIPAEFLIYTTYDEVTSGALLARTMQNAFFGRDAENLKGEMNSLHDELRKKHTLLNEIAKKVGAVDNPNGVPKFTKTQKLRAELEAEREENVPGKTGREKLKNLKNAVDQYKNLVGRPKLGLNGALQHVNAYFDSDLGPFKDEAMFWELLGLNAYFVLNQPKSGLTNLMSTFDFTMKFGGAFSKEAALGVVNSWQTVGAEVFGGILANMGIDGANVPLANKFLKSHQYADELMDIFFMTSENDIGLRKNLLDVGSGGVKRASKTQIFRHDILRPLKNLIDYDSLRGTKVTNEDGTRKYAPLSTRTLFLKPFSYFGTLANHSIAVATARRVDSLVLEVARYMQAVEARLPDDHQVTSEELGRTGSSKRAFDILNRDLEYYGLGSLSNLARDYLERRKSGDKRPLTKEQVIAIGHMGVNEVAMEGGFATKPGAFSSTWYGRVFAPLQSWSIKKVNQANESVRNEETGEVEAKALALMMGTLVLVSVPLGMAYSFLSDEYDEELLGKGSPLRPAPKTTMIPLAGLFMGDPKENAKAMLERVARAGNVGGMALDFANTAYNYADPYSYNRGFSLDTRVLLMSQATNTVKALGNLIHMGGRVDYANVVRPFLYSMGANGPLQHYNMMANLFDHDSEERRISRQVGNRHKIRAGLNVLGIERRPMVGGGMPKTAFSAAVREMERAAEADDPNGFNKAYSDAIEYSIERGDEDPEKAVLNAFKRRNYRQGIARYKLSDEEWNNILSLYTREESMPLRYAMEQHEKYVDILNASTSSRVKKKTKSLNLTTPASYEELIRRSLSY